MREKGTGKWLYGARVYRLIERSTGEARVRPFLRNPRERIPHAQ